MNPKYLLIPLLLALAFPAYSGELPTPNQFGGDFSFPSTTGNRQSISALKGKLLVVNFGFTSCPDVCPMVLAKLAAAQKKLDPKAEKLQVLFVTVDPERDSIESMSVYLPKFHRSFIGMRGESEAEIQSVLKRYGGYVSSQISSEGKKEISHTDYVYLINQQGYVAGFYDVKTSYQELLDRLEKLI